MNDKGPLVAIGMHVSHSTEEVEERRCMTWDTKIRPRDKVELSHISHFIRNSSMYGDIDRKL